MSQSTENTAENLPSQCFLLNLPTELQLDIYALAVTSSSPLLINCPCDSSYLGRYDAKTTDEAAWASGDLGPPQQPALTRTCRSIRAKALPIFYKENVFRAGYCQATEAGRDAAAKWLKMIGKGNRESLRHFYFYDRNQGQDRQSRDMLQELKECEIFKDMGGRMKTMSSQWCCAHLVGFGDWEAKGRGGRMEIAEEENVPRLRTEGEK
jgi:hypothetical protein